MRWMRCGSTHWPGNVRELRNLVERVLILNPRAQRIERKHLPVLVSSRCGRAMGAGGGAGGVFVVAGGARGV